MATHFASNVLLGSTMMLIFTRSDATVYYVLAITCAGLAALAILWKTRYRLAYVEYAERMTQEA